MLSEKKSKKKYVKKYILSGGIGVEYNAFDEVYGLCHSDCQEGLDNLMAKVSDETRDKTSYRVFYKIYVGLINMQDLLRHQIAMNLSIRVK